MIRKLFSHTKKTAGFTLVELLIYFALVSILFIQLTSLFITVLEAKQDAHATSAVEREGQFILSRLSYDIQRADQVQVPGSLGQQTDQIGLTIAGQPTNYLLQDGQLFLQRNGEMIPVSSEVEISNFSVTRIGNVGGKATLQVSFDATSYIQESSGQETRHYQTAIGIR